MIRTSHTHPLRIAEVRTPRGGMIGITFCPGKHQTFAMSGIWARDLGVDLEAIRAWGAEIALTLVTEPELKELRVEALGQSVADLGMRWLHLPIEDVSTPTPEWERQWSGERAVIHALLNRGGKVLVHCKGGLGRAGLVAARILVEEGVKPQQAIDTVRTVREGAIETAAQEEYLKSIADPQAWA